MKIELEKEKEWGYFISPQTFHVHTIKDEIPEESFVLIKEKEYNEEIDRIIIQTTYGIVNNNKFTPYNKREISKIMSKVCGKYILNNNSLPPKMRLEKELREKKPVYLAFQVTNYDTFHLKITNEHLSNMDPVEIFKGLLENESAKLTTYQQEDNWLIEYAKSNRSRCRSCGIKIEKGSIRIGEPYYFEDHLNYKWHHEKCVFWKSLDKNNLLFNELKKEDKKRILSYFDE
ncbi:MAG: PARP-type zinc finger-containing protein [Candidatus Heimdallarchaeaceae archaeon]